MTDPDTTTPVQKPSPAYDDADVTDTRVHDMMAAGMSVSAARNRSGTWQPPSIEELQEALTQYDVTAFLARGGMGAVYKGTQRALKRSVAIKVLPPDIEHDDLQFADRFKHEAEAMARLSHPNIVSVFDAGETSSGLLYFVMEFVEGTDVQQIISADGKLEPTHALSITAMVCDALAFAHEEGIIHRDIKPSNIMLDKRRWVKVADFGLAKAIGQDSGGFTRSDVALGTADFIAPEALLTGVKLDARADLYAVGVMLYTMLTGRIPKGRFEMPSGVVPCLDPRIDAIVDKAMQTDREKRYGTAAEMKSALEALTPNSTYAVRLQEHEVSGRGAAHKETVKAASNHRFFKKPLLFAVAVIALLAATGMFFHFSKGHASVSPVSSALRSSVPPSPSPQAQGPFSETPATATKAAPFVNSLGMMFVPVPITGGGKSGQRVLFSIWETRNIDYASFAEETLRPWDPPLGRDAATVVKLFPNYAATGVSWQDATAYCAWLTARERKAGRIGNELAYRLPSDHEWSCAVGIGDKEDPAKTPLEKKGELPGVYPWGTTWPPPPGSGNFADESFHKQKDHASSDFFHGYDDGYKELSPVGLCHPNEFGLYDLAGNALEWCEDLSGSSHQLAIQRGGSWNDGPAVDGRHFLSSMRTEASIISRQSTNGFRCVLAPVSSPAASAPKTAWHQRPSPLGADSRATIWHL